MLKITSSLLCGLLLVAVTGCQTAHSVKDTIVNWRPSFGKGERVEQAPESLAEIEKDQSEGEDELNSLQVKTASLKQAAEDFESPSLKQIIDEEQVSEVAKVEEKLTAFEEFQNSLKAKELEVSQLATDVEQAVEETKSEAKMVIQEQVTETPSEVENVDPAFVNTEKLTEEIDALLSENESETEKQPEDSPFEEEQKVVEQQVEVIQQAILTSKNEAGDIAFDLASFADSSISNPETLSELEAETAEEVTKTESIQTEYPWALNGDQQVAEAQSEIAQNPTEKVTAKQIAKAIIQPRKVTVSEEILHNLEQALGDENWRAAGRARVQSNSEDVQPQSDEFKQVAELIRNQNAKVRLQGLRLAVQQGNETPEVASLIEFLLDDEDQVVKAHAASSLNQWKQSPEKVINALASVLASQDENARQFAAMYLGDMNDQKQQIIPILETHLLSAQSMTALHLSEALLKLEPSHVNAVSRLTSLMRDKNVEVRWLSAHALGAVQGELQPYAVEALRGGLRDVDSQVRSTSALALGGLGSASQVAVAELNFMLEHGETNVKDAAKIALDCIQ